MQRKFKIFLHYILGPALGVWTTISLVQLLQQQENLQAAWEMMKQGMFKQGGWGLFLLVIAGMLLNWYLEIRKWQLMVQNVEPVSFKKALATVLGSLAVGLATPNRLGEYGMRAMYLNPSSRRSGVFYTVFSSVAQLLATSVFGIIAFLIWYWDRRASSLHLTSFVSPFLFYLILFISVVVLSFIFLFIYKTSFLQKMIVDSSLLRRFFPSSSGYEIFITNPLRKKIVFFSILRYLVFTTQLMLLWHITDTGVLTHEAFVGAGVIFLLMAFLPTIAFADLGIRGQVSVWVMSIYSQNFVAILVGMVVLWMINLIIPALVGSVMVWSIRKQRTNQ